MSKRIEEILDVVQEVRKRFQNEPGGHSVKSLRIQALYSVAEQHGIQSTSVSNNFRRRLRPDIDGTPEFDRLLEDWLVSGSDELGSILRQHASDSGDLERIKSVFTDISEPDLSLLAQEFGYEPNDVAFMEGKAQFKLHLIRERSRSLVALAKELWKREHGGQPCCSICGFSFSQTYGNLGEGFIQAHHKQAISSLGSDTPRTPDDLAPVCSNCHSILHRRRPWPTVEEVRKVVLRERDLGPFS